MTKQLNNYDEYLKSADWKVHRDAPEEGFDVDANQSYNHVNFQNDEGVASVRQNQIFMEPDRRY